MLVNRTTSYQKDSSGFWFMIILGFDLYPGSLHHTSPWASHSPIFTPGVPHCPVLEHKLKGLFITSSTVPHSWLSSREIFSRELKLLKIKYLLLCWFFQINSNGLRQQDNFYILISWVKSKCLVKVNLTAAQHISVSANTSQNIQVTFKRLLWIFHSQRILDETNGCQSRSLSMTYLAHFLPFLPLRLF